MSYTSVNEPLVSVLMTSYNREKFITDAIMSVLSSTYQNWELIVSDDTSSDNTVSIAKQFADKDSRIKVYVNETNLGDYPNRNRAASLATGKYIKYVDSDDLIYKHTLQVMVDFMEEHPGTALGVSSTVGNTKQPFPHLFTPENALRHHFFVKNFLDCAPTGSIINRSIFNELGGFSGRRMIGDVEFGFMCAVKYPVLLLPPGLVFWREHGDQEVFYGINNNMYTSELDEFYKSFFAKLSDDVFSKDDVSQFWTNRKKQNRKNFVKSFVKKIMS